MAKRTERNELRAILRELKQIRRANEKHLPCKHIRPLAEHDHVLRGKRCWCSPGVILSDDAETEIIIHQRMN